MPSFGNLNRKHLVLATIALLLMLAGAMLFALRGSGSSSASAPEQANEIVNDLANSLTGPNDTADSVEKGAPLLSSPISGRVVQASPYTVQNTPFSGAADFNHADFESIGFCVDYDMSAPDIGDVYNETTTAALGMSAATADNVSATLQAFSDPSITSSYSLSTIQRQVQYAIWAFTNGRSVSGLSATIYNNVLNGTYTPQPAKWLDNGGSDQPLVVLIKGSDYGDAPPSYQDAWATINENLTLGAVVDFDSGQQNSADATGDDSDGTDDEDAVTFIGGVGTPGSTNNALQITVLNNKPGAPTTETRNVRDDFNSAQYSNNDGADNWNADWVESSESNGPSAGNTTIAGGDLLLTNHSGSDNFQTTYRCADLSSATNATLNIGVETFGTIDASHNVGVWVQASGGSFTPLLYFFDDQSYRTESFDISAHLSSNTCIGFTLKAGFTDSNDFFAVDFAEISYEAETGVGPSPDAYLTGWIDFNGDGDFDADEQIITDQLVSGSASLQTLNLTYDVPANAVAGATFARFRIACATGASATGLAPMDDGEVEDYQIVIPGASDYGDAPASYGDASAEITGELYLGSLIDEESESQYSAEANGDDTDGTDDEDGVVFVNGIGVPGSTGNQVDITVFHGLNVPGQDDSTLTIWIDFDGSGTFEASEKIVDAYVISESASVQNLSLNYNVPANAAPGSTYARVRLNGGTNSSPTGTANGSVGEVEDYKVTIASPSSCYVVDPNYLGLSAGTFVETSFPGVTISTGDTNHRPMIFDSSSPTGNDSDLGTPNQAFGGPGVGAGGASGAGQNSFGLGNLIIISQDNNQGNPNDYAGGGTLTYSFANLQTITYIDFVDADEASIPTAVLYDSDNNILGTFNGAAVGENSYQRMIIEDAVAGLGVTNVARIEITFPGSGAVGVIGNCSVSLGSTVFEDADNNGQQNGENGIPNVTVQLFNLGGDGQVGGGDDQLVATDVTDGNGDYLFDYLDEGSYYVVIPTPPASAPTVSSSVDTADNQQDGDNNGSQSGGSGTAVTSPVIELSAGDEPTGSAESGQAGTQDDSDDANGDMTVDFGFVPTPAYTLGNRVFNDINRNGIQDDGEPGVDGVTVELYFNASCIGPADQTDTTEDGGYYEFTNLPAGDYCIRFSNLPADYIVSVANQGSDDAVDSDGIDTGNGTATIPNISLSSNDLTQDLGIHQKGPLAAIGDFVWYDSDADGIQDAGEPGIGNVTLDLYLDDGDGICEPGGDDTLVDTTVTNADGSYLFTVAPGSYCVDVTDTNGKLTGLTHTTGSQSVTDPSPVVTLGAGEWDLDQDFGYYKPVSSGNALIGDTVWYDDGDGIQEPGEMGIAGVTVSVKDSNGVVIAVAVTDENGNYLIEVPAGTYTVTVDAGTLPAGLTQSGDPDGVMDGETVISVAAGETNLTADFGYTESGNTLGSIGNQIWIDDGDGTYEPATESGIPGVSVNLIQDTNGNGVWDAGEPVVATVYTDENGQYAFNNVPAGDYVVHVSDTSNVLRDYNPIVGPNPGADNNAQGGDYAVSLPAGGVDRTADFGYISNGETNIGVIGNTVWYETDKDGLYEAGELGLAGVTVELRDSNGNFIAKTTTAGSGKYAFPGLAGDDYQVVVTDEFGILSAFEVTTLGATPSADHNNQAQAYAITLPQGGINMTADFGYTDPAPTNLSIGNYVWVDENNNGIQDEDASFAVPNVPMRLYRDSNGNGQFDETDELVDSTSTDANGFYRFDNLPVDIYFVNIPLEALFGPTLIPELSAGPADQVGTGDTANDNNGFPASNPFLGITSGAIDLGGNEPAEGGRYNDTVDFGFKALDPTSVALSGISAETTTSFALALLSIVLLGATARVIQRRS